MSSDPITVPVAPTSNTEPTRRELNLQACVYAFEGVERLPPLKTEALRSVGNAFDRNVGRVFALVFFPAIAITDAMITMACAAQVLEQMPGSSEEDQKKTIFARMAAHYDYRAATMKTGGAAETLKDVEFSAAFSFLGTTGRTVVDGAEGWLAGQITGAWTAFEAMAEDLWETALNTKPKWLAGLSGDDRLNRRQQREPRQDPRRQGDEGKKVDLEWLQRNGYDLSKCMGTVHKRRYKFDALLGIREAYAEAFSRDYDTIDAILSDKALDALALVRNNLVHNGGIIDEQIVRRAGDLPTELRTTTSIGQPMLLNGELVSQLVGPVFKCGYGLVLAVDDWLASH